MLETSEMIERLKITQSRIGKVYEKERKSLMKTCFFVGFFTGFCLGVFITIYMMR